MQVKQEVRRLNSIRGLAVIIVMLSHYSNESGIWGGLLGQGAGQLGVMLFFMLSAFLMAHLYFDSSSTAEHLKKFAVARIARVIPLFLVVVFLSYIIYQLPPLSARAYVYNIPDLSSLFSHLLLLSGTNVLWSIPPEIHFYAIFAFLWLLKSHLKSAVIIFPIGLLAIYIFLPAQKPVETSLLGIYVKLSLIQVYPYFCVGLLLGWLYKHWRAPQYLISHFCVLILLAIPFLYPNVFIKITGSSHGIWSDPILLIALAAIFFVLVFLVPERNLLLENSVGDFLGKVSYSAYLLHYPLLVFLKDLGYMQELSGMIIFLCCTLLLATLSFKYVEVPASAWIKSSFN